MSNTNKCPDCNCPQCPELECPPQIKMNDIIFLGNILTLNNLILNIIRTYTPTQVESRI